MTFARPRNKLIFLIIIFIYMKKLQGHNPLEQNQLIHDTRWDKNYQSKEKLRP